MRLKTKNANLRADRRGPQDDVNASSTWLSLQPRSGDDRWAALTSCDVCIGCCKLSETINQFRSRSSSCQLFSAAIVVVRLQFHPLKRRKANVTVCRRVQWRWQGVTWRRILAARPSPNHDRQETNNPWARHETATLEAAFHQEQFKYWDESLDPTRQFLQLGCKRFSRWSRRYAGASEHWPDVLHVWHNDKQAKSVGELADFAVWRAIIFLRLPVLTPTNRWTMRCALSSWPRWPARLLPQSRRNSQFNDSSAEWIHIYDDSPFQWHKAALIGTHILNICHMESAADVSLSNKQDIIVAWFTSFQWSRVSSDLVRMPRLWGMPITSSKWVENDSMISNNSISNVHVGCQSWNKLRNHVFKQLFHFRIEIERLKIQRKVHS